MFDNAKLGYLKWKLAKAEEEFEEAERKYVNLQGHIQKIKSDIEKVQMSRK